jgi:uncharacterized protein YndB with AHSA1/START domain
MPQTEAVSTLELTMNRTFNAPRERLFRAWTVPAEMDRWFSPSPETTIRSSVDLRVGGAYKIELTTGERVFGAHGIYREIVPPERLVFTWNAINCGEVAATDTLVTVEFFDAGDETQVTLTHQGFPDVEMRDRHNQGWDGGFRRLEALLFGK